MLKTSLDVNLLQCLVVDLSLLAGERVLEAGVVARVHSTLAQLAEARLSRHGQ